MLKEIEIKVKGMMCEGCENRIKNALSTINGVEKVEADHKTGLVKIAMSTEIEKDKLTEKIEDLGFDVSVGT